MSRQVSRGSAGKYQADERAGVAGLRWRELRPVASLKTFEFNDP